MNTMRNAEATRSVDTAVINRQPMHSTLALPHENVEAKKSRETDSVVVSEVTPQLRSGWDEFVRTSPTSSFFHNQHWIEAVHEVYGHTPRCLIAYSGVSCRVRGVLPLFEVHGPFTGHALISVPYGVYGGAAADSSSVQNDLLKAARELADSSNASYLEVRQGTPLERFNNRCHYFTFRKRMPMAAGDVLESFPGKARTAIRQAIKTYGLTAANGPDLLDQFYKLYVVSLRRLASPPHQRLFFERLLERFGDRCEVHVAYHRDTPVAGAIALKHRDAIAPYFVGLDRAFARMNTSNFLYYHLMTYAIEAGLRTFDLGRTRQDNTGGCQFKINQGFSGEPLHYGYYSPKGSPAPDLRHSNPKFQIAQAIWRKLPLRCVSLMGGIATRWLP